MYKYSPVVTLVTLYKLTTLNVQKCIFRFSSKKKAPLKNITKLRLVKPKVNDPF